MIDLKNLKFVIEAVKEALQREDKVLDHLFLASEWCSRQMEFDGVNYQEWFDMEGLKDVLWEEEYRADITQLFGADIVSSILNVLGQWISNLKVYLSYGSEESTEYFVEDTLVSTNNYYQIMNHLIEATFYIKAI